MSSDWYESRRARFRRTHLVVGALLLVSSCVAAFEELLKPGPVVWRDMGIGVVGLALATLIVGFAWRWRLRASAWSIIGAIAAIGVAALFVATYPSGLVVGTCCLIAITALPENVFASRAPRAPWALLCFAIYEIAVISRATVLREVLPSGIAFGADYTFVFVAPPVGFAVVRVLTLRTLGELKSALATSESLRGQAEQASEAKSRFLANMSHELRTPINAIVGYAELLEEEGRLDAQQRADLDRIRQSAHHLLALVSDVLDLAKIEAGSMEVRLEAVDLGRAVFEAVAAVRPLIERGRNEVVVEVDAAPTAEADRGKLAQILLNLLSNAAKFTERGRVIARAGIDEGGAWFIEIEDTGVGIAPEELGAIFERFRQVDDGPTRRTGGTGLGLAISTQLAEMMGMRLEARSEAGVGSVFRVREGSGARTRLDNPRRGG